MTQCIILTPGFILALSFILTLGVILTFHVRTYIDPHLCFGQQLLPEFLGVKSFVQSAALAPNTPESRLHLVISLTNWFDPDTTRIKWRHQGNCSRRDLLRGHISVQARMLFKSIQMRSAN